MNNKMISRLISMMMVMAGLMLTSCGGDDDGDPTTSGATTATAEPVLCIQSEMLDYFDITCTIDGETVTLTKDNTYNTTYTPFGGFPQSVCRYQAASKQYKKFPATMNLTAQCKVKDGVNLKNMEELTYLFYVDIIPSNNNGDKFSTYNRNPGAFHSYDGLRLKDMSADKLDKFVKSIENVTLTTTAQFDNANSAVVK